MDKSLALLEFNPITTGYIVVDKLLKTFSVDLIRHNRICPGALLSILSGNTEDINEIVQFCTENKIRCQSILNISEEIISYIDKNTLKKANNSAPIVNIGIFETRHCLHAIKAADVMIKASAIQVEKLDFSLGLYGKGLLIISGNISDLKSAIKMAEQFVPEHDIMQSAIIPNVAPELIDRRFL